MSGTAAIYVRISDPNNPSDVSLETQEAGCRAWCAERGITVGTVYRERQTGVTIWERPELRRLMADAERGGFELVVFYAQERLTRDPEHMATLKTMFAFSGVRLACVTEPLAEDDAGVLVQFVRGWAAKREWGQIRERTLRGKRARVERGMLPGAGPDRYGWVKDRESGTARLNEPEASIVRRIYGWADSGISIEEICRRLNAERVPPPSAGKYQRRQDGAQWRRSQVRRILRFEGYSGVAYAWRYQYDAERKRAVDRPREEWIALPDGTLPAIVDRALWDRVQVRLDTNRGQWKRNQDKVNQYLLRGLIDCAVCGRPCYSESSYQWRYYRCSARRVATACGARMVPADLVEADVWETVTAFIRNPAQVQAARASMEQADDGDLDAQIAAATVRIGKIRQGQDRLLTRARQSESIPWELVERQIAQAERERQAEERLIAELTQRRTAHHRIDAQFAELASWCERVATQLDRAPFALRREILELLEVRVTADGREWRIDPPWLHLAL